MYICPTLESDKFAEIGGLVVDERQRDRGIGKALMAQAETWAHGRGLRDVRLRSNVIRKEAHRFYEAIGYEIFKSQFTFRKTIS